MHIVPPPAAGAASPTRTIPSICPICGQKPTRDGTPRMIDGAVSAYFLCEREHLWGVRWAPSNDEGEVAKNA